MEVTSLEVLTIGRLSSLPQDTPASQTRNASATGETKLFGGKMHVLHDGHALPEGAVFDGSWDWFSFKHF